MLETVTVDIRTARLSGMGTYLVNVLPRLVRLSPNTEFVLLGQPEDLAVLEVAGLPNVDFVVATSPIYSLREQLELPRLIPAATSLFWSPHYPVPAAYRGKLLVTVHDVFHLAMLEHVGGPVKHLYAAAMFKLLRHRADAILTVSEFSKSELQRLTSPHKQAVTVTPLGVGAEWFLPPDGVSLAARPYILFVGNVKPHKNVRGLLEAFRLVKDTLPHDLVIVGKKDGFITPETGLGPYLHDLGDRVGFTGFVEATLLRRYMAQASVFVLPSFYEGFGLPPLEAMASGTPVIVSRRASLPEVCGDAALYCDPSSAEDIAAKLLELLTQPALQTELREKGRARARRFSWDTCARDTLAVMDKVLSA